MRVPPRRLGVVPVVAAAAVVAGVVAFVVATVVAGGDGGESGAANELALSPGVEAPEVVLPATTGEMVDVAAFRGKQEVLLYFYEHAG
jgi:hypothetical protein